MHRKSSERAVICKNTLYQFLSKIITASVTLVTTILIASHFGSLEYGNFVKVSTYIGMFYLFVDFGMNAVFLQHEEFYFKELFSIRFFLSLVLVFLANIFVLILPSSDVLSTGFPSTLRLGIFIFSFTILLQGISITALAAFQKKLSYSLMTKAAIIGGVVTLCAVFATVFFSLPLDFIFLSFVLGGFLTGIVSLVFTKEKLLPFKIGRHFLKIIGKESLPIGLMLIFNLIYFRSDLLLLSFLRPAQDVGIYGIAFRFFDFFIAIPLFMSNALYPFLLKAKDSNSFFVKVKKNSFLYLVLSMVLVVVAWIIAPFFFSFKSDFEIAIIPFRILLVSLPVFFLTSLFQWAIIVRKNQFFLAYVYFASAVLNVVLNVIYIPHYSYVGSAVITGISECFVLILLFAKVIKYEKQK